jgi:hypothetical protein
MSGFYSYNFFSFDSFLFDSFCSVFYWMWTPLQELIFLFLISLVVASFVTHKPFATKYVQRSVVGCCVYLLLVFVVNVWVTSSGGEPVIHRGLYNGSYFLFAGYEWLLVLLAMSLCVACWYIRHPWGLWYLRVILLLLIGVYCFAFAVAASPQG